MEVEIKGFQKYLKLWKSCKKSKMFKKNMEFDTLLLTP